MVQVTDWNSYEARHNLKQWWCFCCMMPYGNHPSCVDNGIVLADLVITIPADGLGPCSIKLAHKGSVVDPFASWVQPYFGMHTTFIRSKPFVTRAGASTRFTSTSTSTSTCNMCEYEYEYLIITWVRVRVRVLVDEFEYKCEYRSMINILYSTYRQQIFIVRSLTRESSDCYKSGTKLQLPIVHVNYLCQYMCIYLFNYSM